MMIDPSKQFDDFNVRARVYPALLMLSPALANILLIWPTAPLVRLAPLAVAIGALFLLADIVRGAGQTLERQLSAEWGGLPAQRALWLTDSDEPLLTVRRRETVERILGRPLPTKRQESRNPTLAAQEYDAAVRSLIPRVRGKQQYPLLHSENIRYSFRRNTLAVRPAAIVIAIVCALGDALALRLDYQSTPGLTALGFSLIALAIWLTIVRKSWVKQAAQTYRDRFYEAVCALTMGDREQ